MSVMDIPYMAWVGFGRFAALTGGIGALLAGCSPTAFVDAVTPKSGYVSAVNQAYGTDPRQRLDIYRPDTPGTARPVVLFFYGGSWRSGSKDGYRFVAQALAKRGIVTAIADYRLFPQVAYPEFNYDAAAAARWVHEHASEYGGDPERVFLMGHSAGAYLAAMVALDPRYLARVGMKPDAFAGLIGISGPYDFLPSTLPDVQEVFATATDLTDAEPIGHVGSDRLPTLLVHGTTDRYVYTYNSERLAAQLAAAGSEVRLELYSWRGHLDIMLGLSSVFEGDSILIRDITDFIASH